MDICSSITRSFPLPSPETWHQTRLLLCRIPRSRGALRHSTERSAEPAWKTKPSWYLVTTEDKMIPPDAQRWMSKRAGSSVVEVKGSHPVYVSQPQPVAALIEKAARGAPAK